MSDKVSLVRVLTSATGNSTPITLGARYSDLFMTPADAGAVDGRTYTWLYVDGNNWELVKGVYTASGTTAARTTVIASRMSGTLGTSRITLSGTAQVRIVESAVDMDGVRGTRSVTGTSDALASTDLGYVVTYSNAAAVAVSLAQAGTASLYDGWATWAQNLGVGTVTITPATSTINGAATLVLPTNHGAFIWSDGTNYHAYFIPVSKPLLAGNNLSDVASAPTARANLGIAQAIVQNQVFTTTGSNTFTTPANTISTTVFKVTLLGGGGGGGAGDTGKSGTGGGSGGGLIKFVSGLSASTGYTITIGAAGTAGANPSGAGGTGGNSTAVFGALTLTANGGVGGPGGLSAPGSAGGVGGTATNGDINVTGQAGSTTIAAGISGYGGSSPFGLGLGGSFVSGVSGNVGRGFGPGGGGGSANGSSGGSGNGGFCLIEWVL